jgi:hypothetical protein
VNAEQWNALYPVSTLVFAYPGARPEDDATDERLVTRTRSKATVLGGHTDVVWVDGHSACISLTHVDPVSESVWRAAKQADETAAAVAAQGALPVPVGDQPQPWNDDRAVQVLSQAGAMCGVCGDEPGDRKCPDCESCRRDYLECLYEEAGWGPRAALLAEVERLKAELAKYVGQEPTVAEEMAYLSRSVQAVADVCDKAEHQALRWENPLPVPEWVGAIRQALELAPASTTDPAEETS